MPVVVIVKVVEAEPLEMLCEDGDGVHVAPCGAPLQAKETVPLKPFGCRHLQRDRAAAAGRKSQSGLAR